MTSSETPHRTQRPGHCRCHIASFPKFVELFFAYKAMCHEVMYLKSKINIFAD